MRYSKDHKSETRQRVVDVASKRFRKDGIEATGLAGLMADAGLTHGGFYAHFSSKNQLVQESITAALDSTRDYLEHAARSARACGVDGMEAIVNAYLRPAHVRHPELGCAIPSLIAEVGRLSSEVRERLIEIVDALVGLIATALPGHLDRTAALDRAHAVLASMIGTLQLARLVTDTDASARILATGRQAALVLARQT
ncbi:TetR/AcrR family transcriptional regulator [Phyllobacterium myrsinacearum]|uniref:TetR/AcrR family transcriptional repressor of nem operon n=1 Tax=Phyllobacterium myrsinacearum TaxID=28101 RepID=A0A839ECX6_9HYPH|nr:TetR/AcrR family transcriptional regulator [Phyllobacterium myrsinacearum]MBA8876792.1 TetR/AcrR family transcriptional repressor of nem operon [Phyllobacterium myrsinacearum]